jgi:hypothetical protein
MEKQTITAQVVMLPNLERNLPENKWGEYKLTKDNEKLDYKMYVHTTGVDIYQHLYFTSDEPIQKGHWYLHENISKPVKESGLLKWGDDLLKRFKVIASTDSSLGLPAIPESFLKQYVDANGKIDSMKLETFPWDSLDDNGKVITNHKLKLTDKNEVVVVEATQYLEVQTPAECLKELEQLIQNQTLEDAAIKYGAIPEEGLDELNGDKIDGFKAGAEWQKEQSATDAIEFFKWINLNYIEHGSHYEDNIKVSSYVHRSEGGVPSRIEKLYELWKQTKTQ